MAGVGYMIVANTPTFLFCKSVHVIIPHTTKLWRFVCGGSLWRSRVSVFDWSVCPSECQSVRQSSLPCEHCNGRYMVKLPVLGIC